MSLRISVLGPLTISLGGVVLKSRPAGERAVLGLLALSGGDLVPLWSVIDAVWDGEPPPSAAGIVQTYVSRLRRVLDQAEGARVLVRDGAGYRLNVTAAELDLLAYRGLVAGAEAAHAVGDVAAAAGMYERAFGMWRGAPLSDVATLREYPALVALAERHRASVLAHAGMVTGDGQPGRALPFLRAVCASHPLDEESHSAFMIALAGAGRQAEALAVYREVRQRLADQLGVDPGPELQAVQARILRQEIPVAGEASGSQSPFQLPALTADFTGRAAESARLEEILASAPAQPGVPLAVVTGPPGSGKTTLALRAAHALSPVFPDGQLWVHLAGTSARPREPGEVLGEFLRTLGMHGSAVPATMEERAVCYRSRLAGHRVLVVADDASTAGQVRPLLPGSAGCALLVTSRSALEGLEARLLPLGMMPAGDGVELLGRITGADRVAAEPEAAASLVQACGGLPLALRIAGARLAARPSWPLGLMANRISTARSKLRELEATDLSVRASIASSYRELPPTAGRAFRLLAVHGPADFAEWVVAAVCGVPEPDGTAVLAELVGRSLVIPLNADATGEPRYRVHDLLREFASEKLAEQEPPAAIRAATGRLLDAWLQLAAAADDRLPPVPDFPRPDDHGKSAALSAIVVRQLTANPAAWFTAERVSLQAAVDQACHHGLVRQARQLTARQGSYHRLQYRYDDAERLWRGVADYADRAGDEQTASYARVGAAMSLVRQGRSPDARVLLDQCVKALEQHGDLAYLAYALAWRATCRWDLNDYGGARADAARGTNVARQAPSRDAEWLNMSMLGLALAHDGEADQAVAAIEAALEIAASLPDHLASELEALLNAAQAYLTAGQPERALPACRRAIELSRGLGDLYCEAEAWGKLGDANLTLGSYQEAVACLSRALAVLRDHGNRRFYAVGLLKLGRAYLALGNPEAAACLQESLSICDELRLPGVAARVRRELARLPVPLQGREQTVKKISSGQADHC
jgi:DNA-binding SARP family transcriptional activator/tetratricopeptide (TPR) repeat protein